MKKFIGSMMILLIACNGGMSAQNSSESPKKEKKDQTSLFNDFYISYGTGTVFYFVDNEGFEANTLSGTFLVGFSRSINKVIAVGFQMSYTKIGRTEQNYYYYYDPEPVVSTGEMTDNLWQGIANVRFRYINTPTFSMYSGIGMGVTMDYYEKTYTNSGTEKGQKLLPAAQLTLLGFRVGRSLAFFGEFGVGTNSILNAGISYKFGD
jgi:hypothetical protein